MAEIIPPSTSNDSTYGGDDDVDSDNLYSGSESESTKSDSDSDFIPSPPVKKQAARYDTQAPSSTSSHTATASLPHQKLRHAATLSPVKRRQAGKRRQQPPPTPSSHACNSSKGASIADSAAFPFNGVPSLTGGGDGRPPSVQPSGVFSPSFYLPYLDSNAYI